MKKFAILLLFPLSAHAVDPYVEYKHDLRFAPGEQDPTRHHLRFGIQHGPVYAEVGPARQSGDNRTSAEVGYKFNFADSWRLKGKWEGNDFDGKHKLETEIRFTF